MSQPREARDAARKCEFCDKAALPDQPYCAEHRPTLQGCAEQPAAHTPDCNCHKCQPYEEWLGESAAWPQHTATIRRVLLGQWADNDARLKALDALKQLEAEVMALQRNQRTGRIIHGDA